MVRSPLVKCSARGSMAVALLGIAAGGKRGRLSSPENDGPG